MLINLYAIFDVKAKLYNKPFYMVNDQVAQRACIQTLNDPTTDIAQNPEDFILYRLGTYEDTTAKIDTDENPVMLFRFHEIQHELTES